VQHAGRETAHDVEHEEAHVPESILDVVAEDPQRPHVAHQVQPTAVQEEAGEERPVVVAREAERVGPIRHEPARGDDAAHVDQLAHALGIERELVDERRARRADREPRHHRRTMDAQGIADREHGVGAAYDARSMSRKHRRQGLPSNPGQGPGMLTIPEGALKPRVRITRYAEGQHELRENVRVDELARSSVGDDVVWIEIEGYGDAELFNVLETRLSVPRLALEDVLSGGARPKLDTFGEILFVVARAAKKGERPEFEQVSVFVRGRMLITFVDEPLEVLAPLRTRLGDATSLTRRSGVDFLLYRVLDCCVDTYVPCLEVLGARMDELEAQAIERPSSKPLHTLYELMRDLRQFMRVALPMRDMVSSLRYEAPQFFQESTYPFLADLRDHTGGVVDLVSHYRELGTDVRELINGELNLRLNQAMRVLAALTAVFGPLTLITGVYGMNFVHMPELAWRYGYLGVIVLLVVVATAIIVWLRKRGWTRIDDG
jgi:magnesium transporter